MKNDLTCGVVRDLLPSYVEGLTSPESNAAVERHLSECPDCAPASDGAGRRAEAGGPGGRKRGGLSKKSEAPGLAAGDRGGSRHGAAVCRWAVAAKLFIIGTPIQTQGMSWVISTDVPGQLDIRVYSIWSGTACRQWETEQEPEGIVRVTCRQVLPSPLSNSSDYRAVLNTEGVNAVYLGDQLIWQGGVEISPQIDRIYQAQTPYVGDAPAVGRVLNALRFDTCGSYTLELHTSSAPYRLTLNFSVPQTSGKMGDSETGLYQDMAAVLAIIGDLDEIECAFRDENGQPWSRVLTVEELNQDLPQIVADYNERFSHDKPCPLYDDVKDYAGSCADLEQLYDAMWWAGEGGFYAETE